MTLLMLLFNNKIKQKSIFNIHYHLKNIQHDCMNLQKSSDFYTRK